MIDHLLAQLLEALARHDVWMIVTIILILLAWKLSAVFDGWIKDRIAIAKRREELDLKQDELFVDATQQFLNLTGEHKCPVLKKSTDDDEKKPR